MHLQAGRMVGGEEEGGSELNISRPWSRARLASSSGQKDLRKELTRILHHKCVQLPFLAYEVNGAGEVLDC